MIIELKNAACGYNQKEIVKDISFTVNSGEILCILGPNGVGKTTLFKSILGFLKFQKGSMKIDGKDMHSFTRKHLATLLGYVPQAHIPSFPYAVQEVVEMGRTAHLGKFSSPSKIDKEIAAEALNSLNISHLGSSIYTEISGGERQLVLIARALAQQPKMLIMDEPTSNLDFGNQIRLLKQITKLSQKGLGIILTSHFPDHAFLCSAKVLLMQKNNKYLLGSAKEVITEESLKAAYGIDVKIVTTQDAAGQEIMSCIPILN